MATLQLRLEDDLRQAASRVAKGMGMDISTAVRMFLTQMVLENGMPFLPTNDPFHSAANREALNRSLQQLNSGQVVVRTMEEPDGRVM